MTCKSLPFNFNFQSTSGSANHTTSTVYHVLKKSSHRILRLQKSLSSPLKSHCLHEHSYCQDLKLPVSNCCTTALHHGAQWQQHLLLLLSISQYHTRRRQLALRGVTSEVTLAHVISRKFTLWNLFALSWCKSFNTTSDWEVFWQHCFKLVLLISSHLVSPRTRSICVKANYRILTRICMCFLIKTDQTLTCWLQQCSCHSEPYGFRTTFPAGSLTNLECLKKILTGINFFQLTVKSTTEACFTSLMLFHIVIQLYLMSQSNFQLSDTFPSLLKLYLWPHKFYCHEKNVTEEQYFV